MKNKLLITILFALIANFLNGQERIFSLGYGKTFVTSDSTTVNITFDLNRMPGRNENAGSFYFVNDVFSSTSKWGYYIKPTMDVNIGSGVTSSPNNISVGLPIGLVYDFPKCQSGIFSYYLEGSPELIADKNFTNNLYYFSINSYVQYEFIENNTLLNITAGVSNANGIRNQILSKERLNDQYGRLTFPLYLKLVTLKGEWKTNKNGVEKIKEFKRINWTNVFKINHIYSDNQSVNKNKDYTFFSSKFDFYLTPNFGINITYFNGHEEPIFKRNNSITFGITLAR